MCYRKRGRLIRRRNTAFPINLTHHFSFFFFFFLNLSFFTCWPHHAAHGILVRRPGIKPAPPAMISGRQSWGWGCWSGEVARGTTPVLPRKALRHHCPGKRKTPLSPIRHWRKAPDVARGPATWRCPRGPRALESQTDV